MLFFQDKDDMPEPKDREYWAALLRGQVLSATTHKFVTYISLADQKAQAMIILNSILIPAALSWADKPQFFLSVIFSILAATVSIFASILCIYPKRRKGHKPDGTRNLLHFGDIGRMREDHYLEKFNPVFNDLSALSEEAIKDLHDISRRIIIPKFFWLKIAYGSFFIGNMLAICVALYTYWHTH